MKSVTRAWGWPTRKTVLLGRLLSILSPEPSISRARSERHWTVDAVSSNPEPRALFQAPSFRRRRHKRLKDNWRQAVVNEVQLPGSPEGVS
tara:strand:- start:7818 stop:8090 length:273 start_codon:yes stop_codon:yes gene_type:complete